MATKTTKSAGVVAHNDYLVANLKNVKETFVGRAQSVQHSADLPNGAIAFLGGLKAGETHIIEASATGKGLPFVMFRPEIITREESRMDKQLGIFRMKGNKPHPAWQLNVLDKIEYSADFFAETPAVGDVFEMKTLGAKFTKNPSATGIVFKVVEEKNAFQPVAYSGEFDLLPASHKMYTVQVIEKQA